MTVDNTIRAAYDHIRRLGRSRPDRPGHDRPANHHPAARQEARLAALTARQRRRAAGMPGAWSRFLLAHARWILAVTLVSVGGAAALAHSQTPLYTSQAQVFVGFPATETGGTLQAPDMATEKGIVASGVVLNPAAHALHVPSADLASGLSVTVPATTFLMNISFSDPNPRVAQERAQAITRSYVSYRTPRPAAATRHRKTGGTPGITTPTAAQLTGASLPATPSNPKYAIDLAAALLVGLILAIATAALRDHLDDRVRGPVDLEDQAGAPVLALIPAFRPASRLVTEANPDSVPAEAYRGLRTRLIRAAASRRARVVLVTSPGRENKSAVAANLAVAIAQTGRSTTLVCADSRWGHAEEFFDPAGPGGPDIGAVNGAVVEADRHAGPVLPPHGSSIPGLQLVLPGSIPDDPVAAGQPSLRTVLSERRRQADLVIIEAPPLLASPDTGALADMAEMVIIVVDARSSTRAQVRAAMREIDPARSKVLGCVLDNVGWRQRLPKPRRPKSAANGHVPHTWAWPRAGTGAREHGPIRGNGGRPDQAVRPGAVLVKHPEQKTREDNR